MMMWSQGNPFLIWACQRHYEDFARVGRVKADSRVMMMKILTVQV